MKDNRIHKEAENPDTDPADGILQVFPYIKPLWEKTENRVASVRSVRMRDIRHRDRGHAQAGISDASPSKDGPSGPTGPIVEVNWPQECIESEKRFGVRHGRLFPLLGQEVLTPSGRGVLVQVFEKQVAVNMGGTVVFVLPETVQPGGAQLKMEPGIHRGSKAAIYGVFGQSDGSE